MEAGLLQAPYSFLFPSVAAREGGLEGRELVPEQRFYASHFGKTARPTLGSTGSWISDELSTTRRVCDLDRQGYSDIIWVLFFLLCILGKTSQ